MKSDPSHSRRISGETARIHDPPRLRGAVRYELGMQAAEHFRYMAVPATRVDARAARRRYSRRDGGATLF